MQLIFDINLFALIHDAIVNSCIKHSRYWRRKSRFPWFMADLQMTKKNISSSRNKNKIIRKVSKCIEFSVTVFIHSRQKFSSFENKSPDFSGTLRPLNSTRTFLWNRLFALSNRHFFDVKTSRYLKLKLFAQYMSKLRWKTNNLTD